MFTDETALAAERLLLRTVVGAMAGHPGIGLWTLGTAPELCAWPPNATAGRAWVREMTAIIHELDDQRPVTCGLHVASLTQDNGLRVNDVFAETDVAVMHGYPMYVAWSQSPLHPHFIPYLAALTTALGGKPCLMEEFGGPTQPPGVPTGVQAWIGYGQSIKLFIPSEEDLAAYLEQTLPALVEAGALGAMLWCFADYDPALWERPPCDESRHERHFGLLRPDGSLKPHAAVIRSFAATRPTVQFPNHPLRLDLSPEDYYRSPELHASRLYRQQLRSTAGR
jgi:endo-1,4-beta-mannosidase